MKNTAFEKIGKDAVKACKGRHQQAMAPSIAGWLRQFCEQSEAFAVAVENGGTLAECMDVVAKGVDTSISDIDAMSRAVKFFFPDAAVKMELSIETPASAKAEPPVLRLLPKEPTGPVSLVLNLEDFF